MLSANYRKFGTHPSAEDSESLELLRSPCARPLPKKYGTSMQSREQHTPEELFSAEFDGEFSGALDISDERKSELRRQWTVLRADLQSLPVRSVDLLPVIHEDLVPTPRRKSAGSRRVWSRRTAWLTAVPAVAAIAAFVMFAIIPLVQNSALDGSLASDRALEQAIDWIDHHPDPAGYQVVVVDIAEDASVEKTVRQMLGDTQEAGTEFTSLHAEIDDGAEYSAGFILTAGTKSQVVLDSLQDSHENLDWNPVNIDGRSHREIKEIFLESMKMPTKSDKVFGAMYVVDEVSQELVRQELSTGTHDVPSAIARVETENAAPAAEDVDSGRRMMSPAARPVAAPLIVILRKRETVRPVVPLPEQGMLLRPHLSEPAV